MASRRTVFSALFLFLSGAALGAVSFHVVMRYLIFRSLPPMPPAPKQAIIQHLNRELHLSGEQKKQLLPIIEESQKKLDEIRLANLPQIEAIVDDAVKQAEPFLEPEQRERLQQLKTRAKEQFKRGPEGRFGMHPEPPRPPEGFEGRRPPEPPFGPDGEPPFPR